ncbi:hypothetical protein BE04_33810 [Sorangium cellulosum]|uniref:CENP-V/GFA domain-containing protein n=2 Tax=Sorangium cellulosum TaxID=56 RepID=A0A150P0N5_SORCE|nr:DUF6151 family protein [Sorangium cellulosum]AGP33965.1 hypothetical protein SCE1572_05330 [Sorangium cellulosum So0157-2]KYF48376.1 hypothetical protein BE04_33810 [Sorangium cellulosum]
MSRDIELQCRCGKLHGWLRDASPSTVNRAVCYCADCQAFLHHLGRADLLDEHGGSDIVQVPPSAISFDRGTEVIAAVRLTPRGLYRWYASCCKTPLGNTPTPRLPVLGIATELFRQAPSASPCDEVFGPPRGGIFGKFAIGEPPPGTVKPNVPLLARTIGKVLGWKISGKTWPHPFFDRASGNPKYPVTVLPQAERDALRPLCGPRPASA